MEIGTIRKEVYVEASPDIVFDVVSRPEHLSRWWPQEAHLEPTPGASGKLVFRDGGQPSEAEKVVPVTVVGEPTAADRAAVSELGATLAATLLA